MVVYAAFRVFALRQLKASHIRSARELKVLGPPPRMASASIVSVRHKMEGSGKLHAHFFLRPGMQKNVGTVFTEPVLSDFFTVLNLFDRRFYEDGALLMAACGLHEDEGADKDMAVVNWRDLVRGDVRKGAKVGQDVEVEVFKEPDTAIAVSDPRRPPTLIASAKAQEAAALCEHEVHSLLALERERTEAGVVERYRVVNPARGPARSQDHAKVWEIVPEDDEA